MAQVSNLYVASQPFVGSEYTRCVAAFARPSDTTTYAVNDVISDSSSVAKCLIFLDAGRQGRITTASVVQHAATQNDFELMLFNSEPTNFADNALINLVAADVPKYLGSFQFSYQNWRPLNNGGTINAYRPQVGELSVGTGWTRDDHGITFVSPSGALFGLLVLRTGSGWTTPTASVRFDVSLSIHRGVAR